jgi:hypothetical protein
LRQDFFIEQLVLLLDEGMRLLADQTINLPGGLAVGGDRHRVELELLLDSGHPNLEELIEVAADDAQETQALKQRRARISGLPEHPPVEGEQTDLAIEEVLRRETGGGLEGRCFGGRGDDVHGFIPSEGMDRAGGFENEHITTIGSLLVDC